MARLLFAFFIVACFQSFGQPQAIFNADFASREIIIDTLFDTQDPGGIKEPIAFDKTISAIATKAKEKDDNGLEEHLRLEQFRYKLKTDKKQVPYKEYEDLLASFHGKDKQYLKIAATQSFADYLYQERNQYGIALGLYLDAYYAYDKLTELEFPLKNRYLYTLGLVYYQFDDYKNAIYYFKKAYPSNGIIKDEHTGTINALALSYLEIAAYDTALHYFEQLYNYAQKAQSKNWILISRLNIGQTYLKQKNYPAARKEMEFCRQYATANNQKFGMSEAAVELSKIALIQRDYANAALYASEPLALWRNMFGASWHYKRLEARQAYEVLSKLALMKSDYETAYLYKDTFLMMQDSFDKQYNAVQLANAEKKSLIDKYNEEKNELTYKQKREVLVRNGLLVFILLGAIIAVMYVNNQKLKQKQLLSEKLKAEDKLTDFTNVLHQKSQLIDEFAKQLEQYKTRDEDAENDEVLFKLQQSTILTDEEWDNFRILFEQVHKGFLNRLRLKMPDLTPAETRFMVLSKLKLAPKDMANILGVGPSAIRKYRYRLRNKLNLPEDGSIDEVVDMI